MAKQGQLLLIAYNVQQAGTTMLGRRALIVSGESMMLMVMPRRHVFFVELVSTHASIWRVLGPPLSLGMC